MKTLATHFSSLILLSCLAVQTMLAQSTTSTNRIPATGCTVPDAMARGYLGSVGVGGTVLSRTRLTGDFIDPDGNAMLSVGWGNPEKLLGLETRLNLYGLTNTQGATGNFGESTVDFHLSRYLKKNWWVGLGVYDAFGWKREPAEKLQSIYCVFSGVVYFMEDYETPFNKLYINAGIGNGRFRTDEKYTLDTEAPMNVFGSMALQFMPEANLIVEYNGYNVFVGGALYPFKKFPGQLVFGMDDVFHENWHFVVGGAIGFNLIGSGPGRLFSKHSAPVPPPPQTSRI